MSPGKLCDCRGFVALKLASRSASVQKFQFFWEVPDRRPTVAMLCTKHAWLSSSLNKLWGSPCWKSSRTANSVHCHKAAVSAVPVEISLFLPFAKMHKHIHSLTGDFGNSQKSDYTISGKAKAKTCSRHLGIPEEMIRLVLGALWVKSSFLPPTTTNLAMSLDWKEQVSLF